MMRLKKDLTSIPFIIGLLMLSVMLVPVCISQHHVVDAKGTPSGWSDDINLSGNLLNDRICHIAAEDSMIHAVWEHTYLAGSDYEIVYVKSLDGGRTWSSFKNISNSNSRTTEPHIDTHQENLHVVWEDWEGADRIDYRNSSDRGDTWNPIKRISSSTGASVRAPRIYVNTSNIHIIWHDKRDGQDGEIYYRRSIDGGITFNNGQGVDEDRRITFSPAPIGGASMGADGSNISIVWYDERNGLFETYWLISKDNGFTWEDGLGNNGLDRRLTFSGTQDPAIAVNGSNIHLVYVDPASLTEYYLYFIHSTDNGATWSSPQLLTGPTPMIASPDITAWGGNIHVTWDDMRDDGTSTEIYYKNSADGGINWGPDIRLTYSEGYDSLWPRIAVYDSTNHIIWWDKRDGNEEIYYKRYPDFPDISPPTHSNEMPLPDSYRDPPGTNVSVHVTDLSGVNASCIQFYVNGSLVVYSLTPIASGYNVSYVSPGFSPGVITCRIVADDNCSNHLDYTWNFTVLNSFKIPVVAGWNLISMPLVPVSLSLPGILLDKGGDTLWDRVMWFDPVDASNHWKQYYTNWNPLLNDLTTFDHEMGIWINVSTVGDGFLDVTGLVADSTSIQLRTGWNLVGYPTLCVNMTVGNAFWGTGATMVEVFDPAATYRTKVVGPTYVMKPGEGYWVYVPVDSIWTVDW